MKLISSNVRVISKETHTYDNGDTVYRVNVSNGDGGMLLCQCSQEYYETLVPFEVMYDMEVEVHTNGWKTYADLVSAYGA